MAQIIWFGGSESYSRGEFKEKLCCTGVCMAYLFLPYTHCQRALLVPDLQAP